MVCCTSGGVAQLVERLHGMQEVREFDSPRLHQKVLVRGVDSVLTEIQTDAWGTFWGQLLLADACGRRQKSYDVSPRRLALQVMHLRPGPGGGCVVRSHREPNPYACAIRNPPSACVRGVDRLWLRDVTQSTKTGP
jgi:hypothetical protein